MNRYSPQLGNLKLILDGQNNELVKTRQCTYNVTLRSVRATIVAVEKQWGLHILSVCCSLRYPACDAHVPYCQLWPVPLFQYFSTLSHKRHDFRGSYWTEKAFWFFSTTFVWNIYHSLKKWARYDQKCISVFTYNIPYSCHILMKLEFSWQILEK